MQDKATRKTAYEQIKEAAPVIGVVVLLYAFLQLLGITCPIKYVTGVSCAGCGMTRAWLHLLMGDIHGAFSYHPLLFLPPVMLVLFLLRHRLRPALYKGLMFTFLALFVIIYAIRMLDPSDSIVVFEPQNGIFIRAIRMIFMLLRR